MSSVSKVMLVVASASANAFPESCKCSLLVGPAAHTADKAWAFDVDKIKMDSCYVGEETNPEAVLWSNFYIKGSHTPRDIRNKIQNKSKTTTPFCKTDKPEHDCANINTWNLENSKLNCLSCDGETKLVFGDNCPKTPTPPSAQACLVDTGRLVHKSGYCPASDNGDAQICVKSLGAKKPNHGTCQTVQASKEQDCKSAAMSDIAYQFYAVNDAGYCAYRYCWEQECGNGATSKGHCSDWKKHPHQKPKNGGHICYIEEHQNTVMV